MSEINKKIEVADKEIEKRSFRIKKDDAEKFKQFAEELGFSQAEAFGAIISAYELIKAKSVLSNREKEITAIENYIEGIRSIYLNALEINQNAENMIRENYSKELDSKQQTIVDLQEKNKELKEEVKALRNIEKSNKELLATTEALKNKILRKEEEINKLNKTNDFFDKLRAEYEEHRDLNIELQKKLKALEEDNTAKTLVVKDLENKLVTLDKEIETTKEFYKNEIDRIVEDNRKTIADNRKTEENNIKSLKEEYKLQISELKSEHKQEIAYIKLESKKDINQLKEEHKALLAELKKEKEALENKIEKIKDEYKIKIDKYNAKVHELENELKESIVKE